MAKGGWVLRLLRREGLVYDGEHFVYTSGRHGEAYVDLRPLFPRTGVVCRLATELALRAQAGPEFDVVIGPDFGGNELAETVAVLLAIGDNRGVKLVRTRKRGEGFIVHPNRHYEQYLQGCRALVVEDVCTTGKTTKAVTRLVRRHGGEAVSIATVVDRSGLKAADFGVEHFVALEEVLMQTHKPADCPFCKEGRPMVVKPGHGWQFQEANPRYPGGFKVLTA